MKRILTFVVLMLAAGPAQGLTFDDARHLLSRTGFGVASPAEIESFLPLYYETVVDRILNGVRKLPIVAVPNFQAHPRERRRVRKMDAERRRDFQRRVRQDRIGLKRWWIEEMLQTDSPLTERLVLFWHNHFVSEAKKVRFGQMVYQQNAVFRHYALGNFGGLLEDISTGPAMLWYLDGQKNRKGKPNENFAREVLELFTLGEGQGYTEFDIREAARAFTGWTVEPTTGKFRFNFGVHDRDIKTFLGQNGNFDGLDILKIILEQQRVAIFITEKLWREFVSPVPDAQAVRRLARIFQKSNYELRPLFKAMLMTPQFRDPNNRGTLIKSPAELIVGTLRLLNFSGVDSQKLLQRHRQMGQDLLDSPDVKGWRGRYGVDYIDNDLAPGAIPSRCHEQRPGSRPCRRQNDQGDEKAAVWQRRSANLVGRRATQARYAAKYSFGDRAGHGGVPPRQAQALVAQSAVGSGLPVEVR